MAGLIQCPHFSISRRSCKIFECTHFFFLLLLFLMKFPKFPLPLGFLINIGKSTQTYLVILPVIYHKLFESQQKCRSSHFLIMHLIQSANYYKARMGSCIHSHNALFHRGICKPILVYTSISQPDAFLVSIPRYRIWEFRM